MEENIRVAVTVDVYKLERVHLWRLQLGNTEGVGFYIYEIRGCIVAGVFEIFDICANNAPINHYNGFGGIVKVKIY